MVDSYAVNTEVTWNWGEGTAKGNIRRVYREKITKTIEGADVTRNADDDNPAYLIEQDDGGKVLKSHSELSKTS